MPLTNGIVGEEAEAVHAFTQAKEIMKSAINNLLYWKDLSGVGYNPAAISFTKGSELYFSYRNYLVDITIGSLGYATQLTPTNFLGLYLFYLDSGEMERTTIDNPDGGIGSFKVQDLVF